MTLAHLFYGSWCVTAALIHMEGMWPENWLFVGLMPQISRERALSSTDQVMRAEMLYQKEEVLDALQ